jgi:hypothetical protein
MRKEPAGWTTKTMKPTSKPNRTVHGLQARAPEKGERGRIKEQMANAEEGGTDAVDIKKGECTMPTKTAMPPAICNRTVMSAGVSITPKNRTGVVVLHS